MMGPRSLLRLLIVCTTIVQPIVMLGIYELFAAGVLNGLWGEYEQGALNGDVLTRYVYPAFALLLYGMMVVFALRLHKTTKLKPVDTLGVVAATIVTILIISWRVITT